MWDVVDRAVGFALGLQLPRGEILWARHADGTPSPYALLTSSSSIYHSLRSALAVARELGHKRPRWELGASRLADVIRDVPEAFAPKDRWAMDWYYPALAGIVDGNAARRRLGALWDTFVLEGWGVRCVADRDWVTPAETAECAMACLAAGLVDEAWRLFEWAQRQRDGDGRYWTGTVLPQQARFPHRGEGHLHGRRPTARRGRPHRVHSGGGSVHPQRRSTGCAACQGVGPHPLSRPASGCEAGIAPIPGRIRAATSGGSASPSAETLIQSILRSS